MIIKNGVFTLELNDQNGAIQSLKNNKGKEFISYSERRNLFAFWVFHEKTEREILDSNVNDGFSVKPPDIGQRFN